ncbi:MAG: hypothetical protein JW910_10660, partial [Anaerolineae bacterium]|nr:hypothetical protein [Anaerolineae bacterium]
DGILDASYMILDGDADGWHATVRRVSFDYAPIFEAFAARGFYEACGPVTRLVIREIQTARPRLFAFKHWCAAHHPGEPTTDALITAFEQANLWDYLPAVFHVNRALQEPDSSIPAPVS